MARRPRPLARDEQTFRDDRLFLIACDDTYAPKQYFDGFKIPRIQIKVIPAQGGLSSSNHVLEALRGYNLDEDDECWLILDTDHYAQGRHLRTFLRSIKAAFSRNIGVCLSKPCFEVWLLLHFDKSAQFLDIKNAGDVLDALKYLNPTFNKLKVDPSQFSVEGLMLAYRQAKQLADAMPYNLIPERNGTDVYQIWRSILKSALPAQLNEKLKLVRDLVLKLEVVDD